MAFLIHQDRTTQFETAEFQLKIVVNDTTSGHVLAIVCDRPLATGYYL